LGDQVPLRRVDKSPLHNAIVREICIALEIMGAAEEHDSAETVYLRVCDEAIRRAAREMKDGWD
jgi:hypothetical protein